MSLNTDIFSQHLSATINRVWLYYRHPIKTTPYGNPATTSQTTPIILAINFQYNFTPTTSHISTKPLKYTIPLHYPHIPHTCNKLHICLVQPRPNIRSHSILFGTFLTRCFARLQRETCRNFLVTRFFGEMSYVFSFTFFSLPLISPCIGGR